MESVREGFCAPWPRYGDGKRRRPKAKKALSFYIFIYYFYTLYCSRLSLSLTASTNSLPMTLQITPIMRTDFTRPEQNCPSCGTKDGVPLVYQEYWKIDGEMAKRFEKGEVILRDPSRADGMRAWVMNRLCLCCG